MTKLQFDRKTIVLLAAGAVTFGLGALASACSVPVAASASPTRAATVPVVATVDEPAPPPVETATMPVERRADPEVAVTSQPAAPAADPAGEEGLVTVVELPGVALSLEAS